jgi:predicted  nucleic acid-binding Zn-ribbon protein
MKTKCTNCETVYEHDEDLTLLNDGEYFKGCGICATDAFLMDMEEPNENPNSFNHASANCV